MHIEHDPSGQRFFAAVAGGVAQLSYADMDDGTLDLYSTYVPSEARGQGIAAQLVAAAMAHAREAGVRVIPSCWYVADWLRAHPEAADLVAG